MGMFSSSAPPPPKPPSLAKEMRSVDSIARLNLKWAKEQHQYADDLGAYLKNSGEQFSAQMLPALSSAFRWAEEDMAEYKAVFQPLQDKQLSDAEGYGSDTQKIRAQQGAVQDLNSQRDAAIAAAQAGRDPSQAAYSAPDRENVGALAAAKNVAREMANQQGADKVYAALAPGQGLNRSSTAWLGQGAAGVAQTASQQQGIAGTQAGLRASALPMSQLASSGYQQTAGLKDSAYDMKLNRYTTKEGLDQSSSDFISSRLGQVGGAALGAMGNTQSGKSWLAGKEAEPTQWMAARSPETTGGATSAPGQSYSNWAAEGGAVKAPGTGTSDSGVVHVSNGEYILPASVVNNIGAMMLDDFVEKRSGTRPTRKQALPVEGITNGSV